VMSSRRALAENKDANLHLKRNDAHYPSVGSSSLKKRAAKYLSTALLSVAYGIRTVILCRQSPAVY
jgi:hypothetical protein